MARPSAGAPPVARSGVVLTDDAQAKLAANYGEITRMLSGNSAGTRAVQAMLGGDKQLLRRFLAVVFSSIANNTQLLLNATPVSIVQAVKDAADLGLEPTGLGGEAAIVVYGDQATLMPMWRGYLKRIRNSRLVQDIDTQLVYTEDEFEWGYNQQGGWFNHKPAKLMTSDDGEILNPRGTYWGAYAYARMPSGFVELEVMPLVDIEDIRRKYSRTTRDDGPWVKSWGEMARKTPLRRLAKRLPQEAVDKLLRLDERIDALTAPDDSRPGLDVGSLRAKALVAAGGVAPAQIVSGPAAEAPRPSGSVPEPVAAQPDDDIPWDNAPHPADQPRGGSR